LTGRLASLSSTEAGTVLRGNISGGVQIRMQLKATHTAFEERPSPTIVAGYMPTATTGLRGMPGVNPGHRTTARFRFVPDKGVQLCEGPAMQAALVLSLPFSFDAPSNVRQVFKDDRTTWVYSVDDLLTQDMITVAPKPGLPAPYLLQVAFCALRPGVLQGPTQFEGTTFHRSPALLPEKLVRARNSWLGQAEVDAHDIVRGLNHWRGEIYHDMQPPSPVSVEKIGGCDLPGKVGSGILWYMKEKTHPALRCRQSDGGHFPIDLEGMHVVARWAGLSFRSRDLAALALQGQAALNSLGRFDAGLNMQVTDEAGSSGFAGVVGGVMQAHAVLLAVRPAIGTEATSLTQRRTAQWPAGTRPRHEKLCPLGCPPRAPKEVQ
jgi:hypothetical protein